MMRRHFNWKNNSPFGVRIPVWLFAFGVPLMCLSIRIHPSRESRRAEHAEIRTETRRSYFFYQRREAARTAVIVAQEDSAEDQSDEFDYAKVKELIQDRSTWRDEPTSRAMR